MDVFAKVCILLMTEASAFEMMLAKVPVIKVRACGGKLYSRESTARSDYEFCIKELRTPKKFEERFLALNAKDFGENGEVFEGTMEVIKSEVSKELASFTVDPSSYNGVHAASESGKFSNVLVPIVGGLLIGVLLFIIVLLRIRKKQFQ